MKYIITEDQQDRLISRMSEIINNKFRDSNIVCEIIVQEADSEEIDGFDFFKGRLKYDVIAHLNQKYISGAGMYGMRVSTQKQIKKILIDWFGLEEDEFYVWVLIRECNKND